jgi:hypothetical protein
VSCRKARRSRPNRKGSKFESLPLIRQGGLATGKIDGSLQPRSSLVAARTFQAPAYVNSDCGTKAMTFDRIQVNALVRMVTAEAGIGQDLYSSENRVQVKRNPAIKCGVVRLHVSTRLQA